MQWTGTGSNRLLSLSSRYLSILAIWWSGKRVLAGSPMPRRFLGAVPMTLRVDGCRGTPSLLVEWFAFVLLQNVPLAEQQTCAKALTGAQVSLPPADPSLVFIELSCLDCDCVYRTCLQQSVYIIPWSSRPTTRREAWVSTRRCTRPGRAVLYLDSRGR